MTEITMDVFDGMSVIEIETFVKDVVKPSLKDRKVSEKVELMASVKDQLHEGDYVVVRWKDSEITGTVVSLREKTFSILTDEVLNAKGEPSRISRGYDFVLEVGAESEDTAKTEETA
jgi:hypothetical protein